MHKKLQMDAPFLSKDERKNVIDTLNEVWSRDSDRIVIVFNLLKETGSLCAYHNIPFFTEATNYIKSSQFYVKSDKVSISVYSLNKDSKKRNRSLTLQLPTGEADPRKTANSTPANFIHHLDAVVALQLHDGFIKKNNDNIIYSNHDRFYTNLNYINDLLPLYNNSVYSTMNQNPSSLIINMFEKNYKNLLINCLKMDYKTADDFIQKIFEFGISVKHSSLNLRLCTKIQKKHEKLWICFRLYLEIIPNRNEIIKICDSILEAFYSVT